MSMPDRKSVAAMYLPSDSSEVEEATDQTAGNPLDHETRAAPDGVFRTKGEAGQAGTGVMPDSIAAKAAWSGPTKGSAVGAWASPSTRTSSIAPGAGGR
jgi:hypothetical protein